MRPHGVGSRQADYTRNFCLGKQIRQLVSCQSQMARLNCSITMIFAHFPHRTIFLIVVLALVAPWATNSVQAQAPMANGAKAWMVVDVHSGRILMERNSNEKREIDGFAGVATALVTLDWSQRTGRDLGAKILIPNAVATAGIGNPMGLQPGDRVSMRDLIYSVVLGADDAACIALASAVGQDLLMRRMRHGEPISEFVKEMNYLAAMNSMSKTRFGSPHGRPWGGKSAGTTTVRDMTQLAMYAMENAGFRFYSMQPDRAVAIDRVSGENARFRVRNYNRFAGQSGVDGVKAVARGLGGPVTLLTSKRNPEVTHGADGVTFLYPRRIIAVADGGGDPTGMAWQLLNAGWQEFDTWTASGRPNDNRLRLSR